MGGGGACVVTCSGASGRCAWSLDTGGGGAWSTTTTFSTASGAAPLSRAASCRGGACRRVTGMESALVKAHQPRPWQSGGQNKRATGVTRQRDDLFGEQKEERNVRRSRRRP
jgi:hypothetical protein